MGAAALTQLTEERADVVHQRLGLFERGEMAAGREHRKRFKLKAASAHARGVL
jgi:hypothetical protein